LPTGGFRIYFNSAWVPAQKKIYHDSSWVNGVTAIDSGFL